MNQAATDNAVAGQSAQSGAVPMGSTWGLAGNLVRVLWMLVGRMLIRLSTEGAHGYRAWLFRRFGARIGKNVEIARSCRVDIPWTLDIRDGARIGDRVILYSLGKITIGEGTVVSHFAHLCAGSHDYTKRTFDLTRPPITIGKHCWIGPDAFVGPGVTVADECVVEARACVFKDTAPGKTYLGNPAKAV
ncbi:MAG: DapH/DapD/GlmU-related protein [Phycisphaerales bacterium]